MLSIVFALLAPPISRLTFSFEYVKKQIKEELDSMSVCADPSGSFKAYREELTKKGLSQEFIPYFGVYLSDLTFMYDGNPDFVDAPDGGQKYIFYEKVELMDKMLEYEK